MFDPRTAALLRSAPDVPGLAAGDLPQALTRHYASLVSRRLRGADTSIGTPGDPWPVDRIADVYEIVASLERDPELRRAAAFVAGTAQQIIARRIAQTPEAEQLPVDRDSVDASAAAALLFLAAEQYADANEAAGSITVPRDGSIEARELGRHIRDLARGNLGAILERSARRRERDNVVPPGRRLDSSALRLLLSHLALGIEQLAAFVLARSEAPDGDLQSARACFQRVIDLASQTSAYALDFGGDLPVPGHLTSRYPGPSHLASLLLSVADGISEAPLTRVPPPAGADTDFWARWLAFRAQTMPFVWRNHRAAIERGFHETGTSAVLILPTGAGKTTVSVLKIAGVLARKKKVVFLAPTHALVDQLTADLQALFPADQFSLQVSGDFDSLLLEDAQLQDIEVMTPERCLAMLSFAPEAFANVGLLVFDECHLLSPSRKIGRALDSMLCLLAFQAAAHDADILLMSAMLKNGEEIAAWVAELTNRPCQSVELLWKPSRQARGVVVYEQAVIKEIVGAARDEQRRLNREKGKVSGSLRKGAEAKLVAQPWVLWGLQHNWKNAERSHGFSRITDGALPLAGGFNGTGGIDIWATPNANHTAAVIALNACRTGLKTIVFVNTKADAVRTAAEVAKELDPVPLVPVEEKLLEALSLELGDRRHAIFGDTSFGAVPHNAAMLRLERKLAEDLFRRATGAKVIVATPTLAQGLNLPAELAVLAGDRRSGDNGKREDLEAHELLNAAARAGRAGHLANGVVILIPEPIITFTSKKTLTRSLQDALESVLPEDDRCIAIADPLETVLDRVMQGNLTDRDVRYTVNRLASLTASDGGTMTAGNLLIRSLAAFRARRRAQEDAYMAKVGQLWKEALRVVAHGPDASVLLLASQSGIALDLLDRLRQRLLGDAGELPATVIGWLDWTLDWLKDDAAARADLLFEISRSINASLGRAAPSAIDAAAMEGLRKPAHAWLGGKPLNAIERLLGGDPTGKVATARLLPRAREFVGTVIPRSLSFIVGVVARLVEELALPDEQPTLSGSLMPGLSACVRRGFDHPAKLEYANANRSLIGRVEVHHAFADMMKSLLDDSDDLL
ncbi:MAG TPA: DEAD/DEAH box helicase [Falsiroseomonas sp.]|jgi:superfamily II DNA/RNA helicase|nr:DEAD/DEAH box helicase [Falsiroseomonas sp.]